MEIDWNAPVGGAAELLACVPGLKPATLAQWQSRDKITRRGAGHGGRATVWHAHDALEVATLCELARLGVLLDNAAYVWSAVRAELIGRQCGTSRRKEPCALFTLDAAGETVVRIFDEADETGEDGPELDRPDAPTTFLVLRIGRLKDARAVRIAAVAPGAVGQP